MKAEAKETQTLDNINPRWISIKRFELEFGVGSSGQENWRRDGILPYTKIGRSVFYDRQIVDKVFEDHCTNGDIYDSIQ